MIRRLSNLDCLQRFNSWILSSLSQVPTHSSSNIFFFGDILHPFPLSLFLSPLCVILPTSQLITHTFTPLSSSTRLLPNVIYLLWKFPQSSLSFQLWSNQWVLCRPPRAKQLYRTATRLNTPSLLLSAINHFLSPLNFGITYLTYLSISIGLPIVFVKRASLWVCHFHFIFLTNHLSDSSPFYAIFVDLIYQHLFRFMFGLFACVLILICIWFCIFFCWNNILG